MHRKTYYPLFQRIIFWSPTPNFPVVVTSFNGIKFLYNICRYQLTSSWVTNTWTITRKTRFWRRRPSNDVITDISGIPFCIIRLNLSYHSIFKACSFICNIPCLNTFYYHRLDFFWSRLFYPKDNWIYRFR